MTGSVRKDTNSDPKCVVFFRVQTPLLWIAACVLWVSAVLTMTACSDDADGAGNINADEDIPNVVSDTGGGGETDTQDILNGDDTEEDVPVSAKPYWRVVDLGETTIWNDVKAYMDGNKPVYILTGTNGVVALYDGVSPRFLNIGPIDGNVESIQAGWAESEESLIVVGTGGVVRHWSPTEQKWKIASGLPQSGLGTFHCIMGSAANNVYAAGDGGQIWHWDGSDWTEVFTQGAGKITKPINDLWVSKDGIVFLGTAGEIVWGKDSQWQTVSVVKPINAIFGFASNDVFAVAGPGAGLDGAILHFTETGWTSQSANAAAALQGLNDVWGSSSTNVFTIGFKGTLIRYSSINGGDLAWDLVLKAEKEDYALAPQTGAPENQQFTPEVLTLRSFWGSGPEDMLIAVEGNAGTANLLHYRRHPL
ncbi:MAG: hypothetical protein HUU55_22825 [Myxococcales bacterium]|nr:hypothetical protein [Myxococcales bacterium]